MTVMEQAATVVRVCPQCDSLTGGTRCMACLETEADAIEFARQMVEQGVEVVGLPRVGRDKRSQFWLDCCLRHFMRMRAELLDAAPAGMYRTCAGCGVETSEAGLRCADCRREGTEELLAEREACAIAEHGESRARRIFWAVIGFGLLLLGTSPFDGWLLELVRMWLGGGAR